MSDDSIVRRVLFTVLPVGFAVLVTSVTLDTPVSHIMLLEDKTGRDLEKAPVESPLISHEDGLYAATKKLWKAEGWRGFVKGFVPNSLIAIFSIASAPLFVAGLARVMPAPRRGTGWIFLNALLVASVQNVLTTIIITPLTIMRTRLRMQPYSRTTKQEWQYMNLRTRLGEWFCVETILPTVLQYAVYDIVQTTLNTALPLPVLPVNSEAIQMMERVTQDMWRGAFASLTSTILSFPFKRCAELTAVTLKPLEEPNIPIHEYHGLADEIVRDSAWNGFFANLQETLIALTPNVAFFLPVNIYITNRMRASTK